MDSKVGKAEESPRSLLCPVPGPRGLRPKAEATKIQTTVTVAREMIRLRTASPSSVRLLA